MLDLQLRQPGVGETAPDIALPAVGGDIVSLDDCLKPVSLVFLRHLA